MWLNIVKKNHFLGEATHREGVVGEGCVKFPCQILTLATWMVNMNCLGIVGEKLARVKV